VVLRIPSSESEIRELGMQVHNKAKIIKDNTNTVLFSNIIPKLSGMKIEKKNVANVNNFNELVKESFAAVKLPEYCALGSSYEPKCTP